MIVKKIQMVSRKAIDLRERGVHALRVETLPLLEEGDLVAEIADLWAAARDHDRVRDEVEMSFDQIASDDRETVQRSDSRLVDSLWTTSTEVLQESRPRVLTRT